jgi:homoserine dehydrogenase
MRTIALIGFGSAGKAFAQLVAEKYAEFPFRIVGIHTARHGTVYNPEGLSATPDFGPAASNVSEFLDRARADFMVELTALNPESGEPALSHIREAFARKMHVVTANKGPVAHAYAALRDEARAAGVEFRFESTVMDGAPVFNMVRHTLPGVKILGFSGALNSTSKVAIAAMREGRSMEDGIAEARRLGITEADASFDIDGWDSAVKAAALANVLMDARVTPLEVDRRGIGRLTPERVMDLAKKRKTISLITRGKLTDEGVRMRVRAEVLDDTDILAAATGTSNLLLLHTDLMGAVGTVSIAPGVKQTAYGVFSDLVDITRTLSYAARA